MDQMEFLASNYFFMSTYVNVFNEKYFFDPSILLKNYNERTHGHSICFIL